MKMLMGFIVICCGAFALGYPIGWAMNNWSSLFIVACLPAGALLAELAQRVSR